MSERPAEATPHRPNGDGAATDGTARVPTDGSRLDAVLAIARSDLRRRSRSPKYLAVALLVAYLAGSVTAGDVRLFVGGGYTGRPTAAWFGAFAAVVATTLLVFGGFSLVRGPITRDRDEGIAPLVATSPVGDATYLLGRWLGYFAVLATVTAALALATVAGFLLHGVGPLALWDLVAPFGLITLPTMALVAAVAVCFEAVAPLARTLGAAVYVFGVLMAMSVTAVAPVPVFDFLGIVVVRDSILADLPVDVSGLERLTFRIAPPEQATTFAYHGMDWGLVELGSRLPMLAAAALTLGAATLAFDRFRADAGLASRLPNPLASVRGDSSAESGDDTAARPASADASATGDPDTTGDAAGAALDRLGGVDPATPRFLDPRVALAELRLALRGHRKLWYLAVVAALAVQMAAPLDTARELVAPLALLLPLSVWSGLGVRERRHRTEALVFTAPRPAGQTVAVWVGGVTVGLLAVAGYALRIGLAGDIAAIAALVAGLAAAPALALAAGAWLGSARAFDTVYLLAWYLGPLQAVAPLDFVGATATDPARTAAYAALAACCLAAAVVGRRRP
ncbi:ABC transporter permease [Halosimplex marinum]|uniref:ABC transporter permease n=1 Tax=Halosimplex marinum TaxID=3396620 RepID=UPI003F547DA4